MTTFLRTSSRWFGALAALALLASLVAHAPHGDDGTSCRACHPTGFGKALLSHAAATVGLVFQTAWVIPLTDEFAERGDTIRLTRERAPPTAS